MNKIMLLIGIAAVLTACGKNDPYYDPDEPTEEEKMLQRRCTDQLIRNHYDETIKISKKCQKFIEHQEKNNKHKD